MDDFEERNREFIARMAADPELRELTRRWLIATARHEYSYHFSWLGRPIIQYPPDIIAIQELIWSVRPKIIIETGVARGGSLILSASILELIGDGEVVGIELDMRSENRLGIENHKLAKRISLIEGSSVDTDTVKKVAGKIGDKSPVMIFLDSNHSEKHVLSELELYSDFVTKGSYLVVFDTIIETMPEDFYVNRNWGRGDNPATAVRRFLEGNSRFVVDHEIDKKLLVSVAPGGYLRCVRD